MDQTMMRKAMENKRDLRPKELRGINRFILKHGAQHQKTLFRAGPTLLKIIIVARTYQDGLASSSHLRVVSPHLYRYRNIRCNHISNSPNSDET
jgi:hypothetical protein